MAFYLKKRETKPYNQLEYISEILKGHSPAAFLVPLEWAERYIDFTGVPGASYKKFDITLTPYLKDPINEWDFKGNIREVTFMCIEQAGKSLSHLIGTIYSILYNPCQALVIYPSDDKAQKINTNVLVPLMKNIPELSAEMDTYRVVKADGYYFQNSIVMFQGSGARISSYPCKIRVFDECDEALQYENTIASVDDIRKRARTFDESMFFKVCSPTAENGTIYKEFKKSSQGFWTLRCQGCGNLTMRSCDIHNLQWDLDQNEQVIPASIRLICPNCKHQHTESQKRKMNLEGAYIHKLPLLIGKHSGYQVGALGVQFEALSWNVIANSQMLAGKSGDKNAKMYFDNSIRGLPYKAHFKGGNLEEQIQKRCRDLISPDNFIGFFMTIDTQGSHLCYTQFGVDEKKNFYLLKWGRVETWEQLTELNNAGYYGKSFIRILIDAGGHRGNEVHSWVKRTPNALSYKGGGCLDRYRYFPEEKRIAVHEKIYKSTLIYYLYEQTKEDNNYFFLPKSNESKEFVELVEHLTSFRPNLTTKEGHIYENWIHQGRKHDFFDCCKMFLVLLEFCINSLPETYWQKSATFLRKKKTFRIVNKKPPTYPGFIHSWCKG